MLKRLIIAAFAVSLVLAFGSIALADQFPGNPGQNEAPDHFIQNHPKLDDLVDARPEQPTFKKPLSALRKLPSGVQNPAPPSLIYFCDVQDYSGPYWYYWTIPDAFGDDLFNTRFTVEAGFNCTLKVAHLLMIADPTVVGDPAGSWGTPDLRVYLWADDGFGFPGALLDSVDVPNASLPAFGYVAADFSAAGWVFSDGDEYHYGWTPVGGGTLAILSDDGSGPYSGEERSSEYFGGAWGTMLNDWGVDVVFNIASERCCSEIPFSDCYAQSYWQNITYIWRTPHTSFGDTAWSMRFDVGGPETLSSVDFFVYNDASLDPAGNNTIYVKVYDDDGSGYPGALLGSASLPPASYPFFPAITSVPFAPLVLDNTFHVAISTNGTWDGTSGIDPGDTYETILSSDGTDGTGRSNGSGDPTWPGPGDWYTMLGWWGADVNFLIDVYMCRDEFSDCSVQNWTDGVVDDSRAIPDGNPALLWAQKFFNEPGGAECELRQVKLHFVRLAADITAGRDSMYTYNTDIQIKTDNAGYPNGSLLHQVTLTPADYAAAGFTGPAFVGDFFITLDLNVVIPSEFWVVIDPQAPSRPFGIRHASNLFTGGGGNDGGMATLYGVDSTYYTALEFFGPPIVDDAALDINASVCCVPFTGRVCAPPDDWSSRSHDLARSGASQLAIEDAWCDLTVDWFYNDVDANTSAQTMGPVVYDGRVYQVVETGAVGSLVRVFDLAVGGPPLYTITLPAPANFVENDPLIVGGFLYIAGGDSRIVYKYDITTTPATFVWSSAALTATGGPLRRANIMLVNVAGTDVLFFGSQLGRAFAMDAGTGALYGGWATNPITLDAGQLVQGSATNGSLLYFGTRLAGTDGDIWAINPATGATSWKLSTSGGRQGAIVFPGLGLPVLTEGFGSLSTEGGVLFSGSNIQTSGFPADGVFYRIDAATGGLLSASANNGMLFANPIIDVNLVYCQGTTRWVGSSMGADMTAYSKLTGALAWISEYYYEDITATNNIARYFANGLLTCEPEPATDIIVNQDERGTLHFWNSLEGTEIFRRSWDYGGGTQNIANGTAIGLDSLGDVHVLAGVFRGSLVSLSKGADRGRLEIQDWDPNIAVEFSVSTSEIYTVPNLLVNTGCADLLFQVVTADEISFGPTDPGISPFVPVRPEILDAATMIAEQMASKAALFAKEAAEINAVENSVVSMTEESFRDERGNRAALAFPPYLNSVVEPFSGQTLPAGDSLDLVLDVDPSQINRGPQTFYIELDTDDEDYYVNSGAGRPNESPQLVITLVGGCLLDSTSLEFGVGSANHQFVFNDGFLAESSGPFGFSIDGDDDAIWMGTYIHGVSQHRVALSIHYTGFNFISWQADPNWCDNSCKPALTTGVGLGAIWNGASYTPISGNMVCASGVDSVQDFGSPWDWDTPGPFSSDSTMGLYLNARTVGAVDEPSLASLTVEILEFTERNGNAVPDWKFGMWADMDVFVNSPGGTGKDTLRTALAHSAAWHTEIGGSTAWGLIKLPYGCGDPTLKNAVLLDSDNSFYAASTGGYLDSFYVYASRPAGQYSMPAASAARDQSSHMTVVEHDFTPNETFDFGIGFFGLHSVAYGAAQQTAVEDLADLTNKWVGFGRGDVNDDELINLGDIMTLADIVGGSIPGAIPFEHLGDVDADNDVDNADLNYLINYYFGCGPCPLGDWQF